MNIPRFSTCAPVNVRFGADWLDNWRKGNKSAQTDQYLGNENSTAGRRLVPGGNDLPNLFEVNPGYAGNGTGPAVQKVEIFQNAGEMPTGTITTTDGEKIEKTPETGLFGWW